MKNVIIIPDGNKLHYLKTENVIRLEARGSYSLVLMKCGTEILSTKNLKSVSHGLDTNIFVRVHAAHIVNTREIDAYIKGRSGQVVMSDGSIVPVSQRRKTEFQKRLNRK